MIVPNINFERCVRISELHAQGLDDVEIAAKTGIGRTTVQRLRNDTGLVPQPKKPKPPKPKRIPSPVPWSVSTIPVRKQMDRFLAAFERVEYARPEESERAKEAGRLGRMPLPPVKITAPSSLERC